jgi:hypothetical protein
MGVSKFILKILKRNQIRKFIQVHNWLKVVLTPSDLFIKKIKIVFKF